MKLAEALQERADLNRKIAQLEDRLEDYVLVQEGEEPLEDPRLLKKELDGAMERLEYLVRQINLTNAQTTIGDISLTGLIAKKDALARKIKAYKSIVASAGRIGYRTWGAEIKIMPAISVIEWQKEIDQMSRDLRVTDNAIQESNWQVDLIE